MVRDIPALLALHRATPTHAPVLLAIPGLPAADSERAGRRLTRHRQACGCVAGAVAMLAGLAVGLAWLAAPHAGWSLAFLGDVLGALGLAVLAGVAGKLAALAWARLRLRAEARRVAAQVGA